MRAKRTRENLWSFLQDACASVDKHQIEATSDNHFADKVAVEATVSRFSDGHHETFVRAPVDHTCTVTTEISKPALTSPVGSSSQNHSSVSLEEYPIRAAWEDEVSEILDASLTQLVQSCYDSLATKITAWPPVEGQSADEGEDTIRLMIVERCENLIILKESVEERRIILRARASAMIEQVMQSLKNNISQD